MIEKTYIYGIKYLSYSDTLRFLAKKLADRYAYNIFMKDPVLSSRAKEERYIVSKCFIKIIDRILSNKNGKETVKTNLLRSLVGQVFLGGSEIRESFNKQYGFYPPLFLTISPTKRCNLDCEGCYANSSKYDNDTLDYDILKRIIKEKNKFWGSYFTVISGGEPLIYKSKGKSIIDLFKEFPDDFFLMYTNATMISEKMAEELAEAGNITTAISVEGFEKETDARRGSGTFKKILQAFENLRKVGVFYGISVTATRENAEIILSDEFNKFYFEEQGALYAWIFHYMPIGRSITLQRMITPQQRLNLFYRMQKTLREKEIFVVDFWNSSPISDGCISAGRSWGYFYIDWNGNIMPCVFNPYYTHNIIEIYNKGGNLNDALFIPFFKRIREWQYKHGYSAKPSGKRNQLLPCPIRDHYKDMFNWINEFQAKPSDEGAKVALKDDKYREGLIQYGKDVDSLTYNTWRQYYIDKN